MAGGERLNSKTRNAFIQPRESKICIGEVKKLGVQDKFLLIFEIPSFFVAKDLCSYIIGFV